MTIRFIANRASATRRGLCGLLLAAVTATLPAPPARAATCSGDPAPSILVPRPTGGEGISPVLLANVAGAVPDFMYASLGGRVKFLDHLSVEGLAQYARDTQLMGSDAVGKNALEELGRATGAGDWTLQIALTRLGSTRVLRLKLVDKRGAIVGSRTREARLPDDDGQVLRAVRTEAIAFALGLDCELRTTRLTPVQPLLELAVTPTRGKTGETLTVTVRLVDLAASRLPEPDQRIVVTYTTPQGEVLSKPLTTDPSGVAQDSLVLGRAHANPGTIRARFVRSDGKIKDASPVKYYVLPALGHLNLSADKAQLRPGDTDTVRASLVHGGGPVANAAINLSASGGAVGTASALTDSAGAAGVSYAAPATPALVDVRASATLPAGAGSTDARISYVVDPGVVMSLTAGGDTLIYGASSLKVDLERAQQAVAGATVHFSLAGGGTLSAASAATDSVGRAEIGFAAPSRAGASTITASVTLDGQTYTRNVTLRYSDPLDALTREIADVKEALYLDPSDATLSRLDRLRGILQGRGEGARYEAMLGDTGLVRNQLFCTHQRAHGDCAAGARSRGETTLGLLKSATAGSSVAAEVFARSRDSLYRCPYPMFSDQQSVVTESATITDISGPPTYQFSIPVGFSLSLALNDDGSVKGMSWRADDPTNPRRFAYGFVPSAATGPTWTGRSTTINVEGLYGSYFMATQYQASASSSTASFTVNSTSASGFVDLYQASFDNVPYTATVSFRANITLPAPPSPTMCNHASLPRVEPGSAPPGPATRR